MKIFFEYNAFSNMSVCSVGTYLDCSSSDHLDLDVFLLNARDILDDILSIVESVVIFKILNLHETCLQLFVQFLSECI